MNNTSAEQLHRAMLLLPLPYKSLADTNLLEYVDTHSHQTGYLAPLRTQQYVEQSVHLPMPHKCDFVQLSNFSLCNNFSSELYSQSSAVSWNDSMASWSRCGDHRGGHPQGRGEGPPDMMGIAL